MTEGPRERLLEAALRLLEQSGPDELQARKLATEVGMSTMSVYTHFGSMRALVQELVREGFVRLDRRQAEVPHTEDPVTDLFRVGLAYREHALTYPQLYRLMFRLGRPSGRTTSRRGDDLAMPELPTELPEGLAAFGHLVTALRRVMEAERIAPGEPVQAAGQLWSAMHGFVLLEIAGFFGPEGQGVEQVLVPLSMNLLIGMGAAPERVRRSAHNAVTLPGT